MKEPKTATDIADVLSDVEVITQGHWEAINAAEIAAGEAKGKPRHKAVDRATLLHLGGV